MGACCSSASAYPEEEEDHSDHGEQPIDIRFSNTSQDGHERPTRSTIRSTRGNRDRGSADFGPPVGTRFGSSRGVPSPSCSSVSLVPVARTGSYDVRVASRTRQNGGDGVIETTRLIIDHLKGNVFINQYLIIKDLGKGAHGTVKLVYNTQDDMLYAMKVIHKRRMRRQSYLAEPRAVANMMRNVGMSPLSPGSQTEMQRGMSPLASPRTPNGMTDEYSNEIAVMKELDHPNVVKLYEVIHDPSNNKLLMTMEYVEGGCVLAGSSPTQKIPIPEATAVKYFRDVVKGLEYLHFNRIVHGDLKPDNLLMSSSGKVKISDFGSARFCEKSDMIFATAGTPTFMAPEMCQGKQFNGFPGDIWALGICLFMFVFGKPPFVGATTYQIYEAIQRAELAFPHEIPVSGELKDLLGRLLQKDPAERISLEEIPAHPWVTRGGALPVLQTSNERAVQRVFEAMRKRNESGGRRTEPSTVPLAAPPEPVDMTKLVPDAEVRHYKDGDVIIAQGHVPEGLYYVQEGYVDMMLMPSEKKLVADEDFADAIDDEEDEDDEAVVTATANVLDNRRSNGSPEGDGDDGSGSDRRSGKGGGDDDDDEDDRKERKGVDDFMALFGARLSDRVSPLGSSPNVTPRNHSVAVTPRHGSQTLAPRNNSTTLAPRYASQSLMAGRRTHHHLSDHHHLLRASHASASMPLPIPLQPQHSSPTPGSGSATPHHHLPAHLANLAPASPSRSHSRSSTAAGGGSGGLLHSPRQNSVSSRLGPPGGAGAGPRMSFSGGGAGALQMRLPSYSAAGAQPGGAGGAGPISPSPLGLSCSNAADMLDDEVTRHPPRDERNPQHGHDHDRTSRDRDRASLTDNTTDGESDARATNNSTAPLDLLRASASARDPAQSPFLVPSPPSTSPQNSRRQLMQEPSFNPRLQRENSGRRGLSRLSGADLLPASAAMPVPSAAVTSGPGRLALLGRAASNRARHSMDSEDGQSHEAAGGSTSRRGGSLLGPHASVPNPSTPPNSSGGALSFPSTLGSGTLGHPPLPPHHPGSSFKDRKKDGHKENGESGSGGKDKHRDKDKEDDVLLLSPTESRRLSVTAGGKGSFRKQGGAMGGAGVVVASGPPGSVSPASSLSRMHSAEHGSKPMPGLLPVFEAIMGGNDSVASEGAASKANSADSIISNADISMQASSSRGGWRRERPAPVQIGGGGLPGGIVPHPQPLGPRAPSGGGNLAGPLIARAGSNSSSAGGAAPGGVLHPLPELIASGGGGGGGSGVGAMSRFRGSVRRSQTHDLEPTHPPLEDMDVAEPDRTSTKVSPRYGPGGAVITAAGGGRDRGHDSMRGMEDDDATAAAAAAAGGRAPRSRVSGDRSSTERTTLERLTPERLTPQGLSTTQEEDSYDAGMSSAMSLAQRRTPDEELRQLPRHAYTDVDRTASGPPGPPPPEYYEGDGAYSSAQPLAAFRRPGADAARKGRMRRHSTSSYNATNILTRVLGVSTGGAPLDRSSIQEWSTTSKLAQKAIQRSDSMHSRMAQMVLRAKQHAVRRKRRGSMQLVTTRGPGSVVGELCIDGKPAPSPSTVVAKGPVTLLVIKNEKVTKYRNQPSVMAALHRSQNASLVQEAMERFVECEQEVVAVEVIRRTITTEPMHGPGGGMDVMGDEGDGYTDDHDDYAEVDGEGEEGHADGERVSSERFMADIYNA